MKRDSIFLGILLELYIGGLANYYDKSESLLNQSRSQDLSKLKNEIKRIAKQSSLSKDDEYAMWNMAATEIEEEYDMLHFNFFRYSFVVLLSLILQEQLDRLCHIFYRTNRNTEPPPTQGEEAINKYKKYITSSGVNLPDTLWQPLHALNIVRNCIVHYSGDVSRVARRRHTFLAQLAQKDIGIAISHQDNESKQTPLYFMDNMLIIEPRYCETTITAIKLLLEAVCKSANLLTKMVWENGKLRFE